MHSNSGPSDFEPLDGAKCGADLDPPFPESLFDGRRDILVFARQQPRARFEQGHSRPESRENGSDLKPGSASADDQHRFRNLFQSPSAAVRRHMLEAGNGKVPRLPTGADDDSVGLELPSRQCFDCSAVNEPAATDIFMHGCAGSIELVPQRRMRTDVGDDLCDAS